MKGKKGGRGQTRYSQLFLCLGGRFLDPLCSMSISGTTSIIIYKIFIYIYKNIENAGPAGEVVVLELALFV